MPGRDRGEEPAFETNGDLPLVPEPTSRHALNILQCSGEVAARFAECASVPGIGRSFLVGRRGLVIMLGSFVVVCDQWPFRGPAGRCADECIGDSPVQSAPKTGR